MSFLFYISGCRSICHTLSKACLMNTVPQYSDFPGGIIRDRQRIGTNFKNFNFNILLICYAADYLID